MWKFTRFEAILAAAFIAVIAATAASARNFTIPAGDLKSALDDYRAQTGVALVVSAEAIRGVHTGGANGDFSADAALSHILSGTGFTVHHDSSGMIAVVRGTRADNEQPIQMDMAVATAPSVTGAALETVTVTSSKIGGDVQNIPISITALSQEQLTTRQIAGGPDLIKEVPNLTFSKTNFTGYNIQIRGIGTQAISVTTDPAVAVALNDMPFIRNHFFEQEFYDLSQAEVLRGPQGTLYGRNATAGVVNIVSAKPTDQFEAMLSTDIGNYNNRRFEGMVNVPVVDDRLDIRVAGEWTKRDGYSFNETTNRPIDGRDLWSSRVTIGWKPSAKLQTYLVWEHFSEDDDRLRSSKQLCKTDPGWAGGDGYGPSFGYADAFSQGCLPVSLYSPQAFEVPNGFSLPFTSALAFVSLINGNIDPYASTKQSLDLRKIDSTLDPTYKAKNDLVEFSADYTMTPSLTLSSQTGFNHDFLYSTEDYNRFDTSPGIFNQFYFPLDRGQISPDGFFCDPQLGCSNRLVGEDLSDEHSWQLNQEVRLASKYDGPFNFSVGGNYMHYETEENYYVFINSLTLASSFILLIDNSIRPPWIAGVTDNSDCLHGTYSDPRLNFPLQECVYIDPNPINRVNNNGHNYFLSQNPYVLNSYAGFGEAYYNVTSDLKLTGGLRWTADRKHFTLLPSAILLGGVGYSPDGVVDQSWDRLTGRFAANWTPKLDFTDQTLVYGSYAHGYKAGGANPPGALLLALGGVGDITQPTHPLTFKPEYIDAFELGTKNTLLDGALTFNGNIFYYDYKNYQISEIVDRTSINLNFNATVKGAELETSWEPVPGLRFAFAGGYEDTKLAKGSQAIDLMDRTAGHDDWIVAKPSATQASNCIIPLYVAEAHPNGSYAGQIFCGEAYSAHLDPVTHSPYVVNPDPAVYHTPPGYPGFDPTTAPNNGEGFDKDLSGNELPNAPHFTTSLSAEYTHPITEDWAATLHSDFYWQSNSFARVFNDRPYDEIHGYANVNLALILTNANGWQVLGYLKNVFDTTAITGDFLNSDDSGLTTNVFLTDPRLFGVRVTKNF